MPFGTNTTLTNLGKAVVANRIAGSGTEPKFLGIGTGATAAARTAAITDTALSTPVESRVGTNNGTVVTTTTTNDTYQVVQTVTATAARAVDEAGLFDASTSGNLFLSATFPVINLETGDSIQITAKVQFT